jgi:pimeloyl-ACP methyl ester carboxylesterase
MAAESPLVLIHGAFQTAATWDLVAPRLERAGRLVIVATLTGLERNASDLRKPWRWTHTFATWLRY